MVTLYPRLGLCFGIEVPSLFQNDRVSCAGVIVGLLLIAFLIWPWGLIIFSSCLSIRLSTDCTPYSVPIILIYWCYWTSYFSSFPLCLLALSKLVVLCTICMHVPVPACLPACLLIYCIFLARESYLAASTIGCKGRQGTCWHFQVSTHTTEPRQLMGPAPSFRSAAGGATGGLAGRYAMMTAGETQRQREGAERERESIHVFQGNT